MSVKKFLATLLTAVLALSLLTSAGAADSSVYRTLYSGEITTLNYLITSSANEYALAANVIDTLVEYDRFGQVRPSLAESWEVSDDGLTWTFHLRHDATWVNADQSMYAPLTAHDFEFAARYILNAQNAASTANILYEVIQGAEAYYKGTATPAEGEEAAPVMEWSTVGVKALDDWTIRYQLITPVPYFLSMTTYVCFMPACEKFVQEKGEAFGVATDNTNLVYCGAYVLSEFKPNEKRVLSRNTNYWDKDRVYIEKVESTYNKEAANIGPELYLRGEVDAVSLSTAVASEWLQAADKADLIHPVRQTSFYSYWYSFNFDPQFDAAYEPENWKKAVNNENFRKSIYYGLDRVKAMMITDPDNAENLIWNTITPPGFVDVNGTDYVLMEGLQYYSDLGAETFDAPRALAARDKAVTELTAEGVTFPVKILMPYNPGTSGWSEECETVEQQLEELLGRDYIDIIIEAGPSTGFLSAVRRCGNYALLKVNWGPDYADPQTFTEPFADGNNYNFLNQADDQKGYQAYLKLVQDAMDITQDIASRYDVFARAEAYLLDHALAIPFGTGTGGYSADRIDPFTVQYAPFGISMERYKGVRLLSKPMNTDEYYDALDAWEEARAAVSAK